MEFAHILIVMVKANAIIGHDTEDVSVRVKGISTVINVLVHVDVLVWMAITTTSATNVANALATVVDV